MLTPKQEIFVASLVKGNSQRQAYIEAYPNAAKWKEESIDSKASNLLKRDKVWTRYEELLKKAEDESILTAIERKRWLTSVIKAEKVTTSDKLKALDLLNKMDGQYIDKVEVKRIETDWFIDGEKA